MAWRNCSCPNSSPWEIKHLFCGNAHKHGTNPPPAPDPLPGKWAEATDFFPMGTAPSVTKLFMKNILLRSNSMAWWMMLSLGSCLVSDLSCAEKFAFRLTGWARRCVSQRSRRTFCSQTPNQHFFYACERLIRFQRCLESIYGQEKCELSTPRVRVPHF